MSNIIRELTLEDYHNNYFKLLGQLTDAPEPTYQAFCQQFNQMQARGCHVVVIERDGRLVASGTVVIEPKMTHNLSFVSHIEDIVVDETCRGQGLAQKIVNYLVEYSRKQSCYKIILDCKVELSKLYQQCGFVLKEHQMALYFELP